MRYTIFNIEEKQRFIDQLREDKAIETYFRKIAPGEMKYNKDISEMTKDELLDTLKMMEVTREQYANEILSGLRAYISWIRLKRNTEAFDLIHELSAREICTLDKIKSTYIGSPKELRHILETTLNPDLFRDSDHNMAYYKKHNRATRDRLLMLLLYSGFTVLELCNLGKADLDGETGIIRFQSNNQIKIIQVDETIVALWREVTQITSVEWESRTMNVDAAIYALDDSDYLFRSVKRKNSTGRLNAYRVSVVIDNIFRLYTEITQIEKKASPENVRRSGLMYKLYQYEMAMGEIDIDMFENILQIKNSKTLRSTKIAHWKSIYNNWKIHFGYM